MASETPDFVEAQVLECVNDDPESLMDECRVCERELPLNSRIFVWGEPFGNLVVLKPFCSQDCTGEYIAEFYSPMLVAIVYRG